MASIRWKEGNVVSLELKDGSHVLSQLLKSPYMVFFDAFSQKDAWAKGAATSASPLFYCAVTRQFLKMSTIKHHSDVQSAELTDLPTRWIEAHHGSRDVTVWKGTSRERTFIDLSERPGGRLIEKDITASGAQPRKVVKASIALDDDKTIDGYEIDLVWVYPYLNERLLLCKKLGKNVDPEKDILFDRELPAAYEDYVNMRARQGKPEDYGYKSPKKKM